MKQFEVHYKYHTVIVAEDIEDARKQFAENHNMDTPTEFHDLETNTTHHVVGVCEVSEQAIFEDDDYSWDDEGVMVLNKYVDEEE